MDVPRLLCISTAMGIRSGWARLSVTRSRIGRGLTREILACEVRGSDTLELWNAILVY